MRRAVKLAHELTVSELDICLIHKGRQKIAKMFRFPKGSGTWARDEFIRQIEIFYTNLSHLSPNPEYSHLRTGELAKTILFKTRRLSRKGSKGIWNDDDRIDYYQIKSQQARRNAKSVAAICMAHDLEDQGNGFSILKTKTFGKAFNLLKGEPFYFQPIATNRLSSGFLVKKNLLATAAHCLQGCHLSELRIVFGYKITNSNDNLPGLVATKDIYHATDIISSEYDLSKDQSDWALVELDREVVDQEVVTLSRRGIHATRHVYILGHPCGLPLKYADQAEVNHIGRAYFAADLDVFSGNSGSPVFDQETHELVGIVARGDYSDFRWAGKGWVTVKYPNSQFKSQPPQCTMATRFSHQIQTCQEVI
jgi:hypothetical protein